MAKPTGAVCNLDCHYCFFLTKEALYPGSQFRMSQDIQRTFIRQYIQAQKVPEVQIAWQGGEPTIMGLEFFQRAVKYSNQYKKYGMQISHAIQTNGTLLDSAWAKFFQSENFLVGISLDGPQAMHDAYRVDKGGQPTFHRVAKAIQLLKEYKVEFNILCTIHAANGDQPLEVYRFFRDEIGAQFIQFIPIVERINPTAKVLTNPPGQSSDQPESPIKEVYRQAGNQVSTRSIRAEQYGNFLIAIFDEWVRRDVGKVFVQMFDVALANWAGSPPGLCIHSETCGNALALEHNGDLYACDHFVEPDYLLGNIQGTPLADLVGSAKQRKFGEDKRDTLVSDCLACPVLFACRGGCPKDRFMTTNKGEYGLNYLCAGYKKFFQHINDAMKFMTNELNHRRPPSNVMNYLRNNPKD
jgi:uncharacterized protein